MTGSLAGKVAIVTGGARGIGRAYAEALVGEGAAVVIADMLEAEGQETAAAICARGGRAVFQRVDVADQASTEAMADKAVAEFGGIDILVNNAAMFASLKGGPLTDLTVERWDKTMAVNVKGAWLCIKAVVPHMRAGGGGVIVNQSSISAFGMPYMLDYTSSKAAVIGLTKSVASELGRDNIRVNCIAPGGTATEGYSEIMGGNMAVAEERAKATQLIAEQMKPDAMVGTLLHLVSDGSRFVTGQTLVVDGGRYFLG
ncbi:SDR family NAD(P)-dependent oxidoreductase [Sphingomonas psychrolutea]|uniref:3-oxoacyl-ACP reductase n=1 Tax=Sphingomonas psychrolutea TaxID=1259676 RepID=A0ABQ1G5B1_9SPHN|nr:glucose 1-dehydrogenase [Sphingomonas psychrolutea]GGA37061.1 3-oxoacyl-ACP reductase [Sphingomonas psychrolutea]